MRVTRPSTSDYTDKNVTRFCIIIEECQQYSTFSGSQVALFIIDYIAKEKISSLYEVDCMIGNLLMMRSVILLLLISFQLSVLPVTAMKKSLLRGSDIDLIDYSIKW